MLGPGTSSTWTFRFPCHATAFIAARFPAAARPPPSRERRYPGGRATNIVSSRPRPIEAGRRRGGRTSPDSAVRSGRPAADWIVHAEGTNQPTRHERDGNGDQEAGQTTGTKDKDYNLIWFTEQSLSNALRLESYVEDAERDGDDELAEFFRAHRAPVARAASRARIFSASVSRARSLSDYDRGWETWPRTTDPASRTTSSTRGSASGDEQAAGRQHRELAEEQPEEGRQEGRQEELGAYTDVER